MNMPRLSMWDVRKRNDFTFFDRQSKEYFYVGGTAMYIHKYTGPQASPDIDTDIRPAGDCSQPNYASSDLPPELQIQDLFFLENRDRTYDPNIYELRGIYTVNDNDFDLRQFGIFLSNDILFIYFHYNDMLDRMGRKLMSGDVLELPHIRENAFLDPNTPAINKYYVIEDASRAAEGFSMTWYNHVWRVRAKPIQNQQEFFDILNSQPTDAAGNIPLDTNVGNPDGTTIGEAAIGPNNDQAISDAIDAQASSQIPYRNYIHGHLYLFPCTDTFKYPPTLAFGDGMIPNGTYPVGRGMTFPDAPEEGEYFLRTDYEPYVLFQRKRNMWKRIEFAWNKPWSPANRVLETFINNNNQHVDSYNNPYPEKQYLSKTVAPQEDFGTAYPNNDPNGDCKP
jgi:hypothetical protein